MTALVARTADQMRKALAAATCPLTFVSPKGGMAMLGGLFFKALIDEAQHAFPECPFIYWVDCGTDPTQATLAMRCGLTHLMVDVDDIYFEKLSSIAEQSGAVLRQDYASDTFDLLHTHDIAKVVAKITSSE